MVLPIYDVVYEPGKDSGVTAISLVARPATSERALFLSEDCLRFSESDHTIVGPVLVPDRLMYRNTSDGEFFVRFSKDTVLDLAFDFTFASDGRGFNIEHSGVGIDATVINSWVETDDYSVCRDYGLEPSMYKGSWFICIKVNPESWEAIRASRATGFSVEVSVRLDTEDAGSIVC